MAAVTVAEIHINIHKNISDKNKNNTQNSDCNGKFESIVGIHAYQDVHNWKMFREGTQVIYATSYDKDAPRLTGLTTGYTKIAHNGNDMGHRLVKNIMTGDYDKAVILFMTISDAENAKKKI
jgi:putative alpha-1,2-mannosidase